MNSSFVLFYFISLTSIHFCMFCGNESDAVGEVEEIDPKGFKLSRELLKKLVPKVPDHHLSLLSPSLLSSRQTSSNPTAVGLD